MNSDQMFRDMMRDMVAPFGLPLGDPFGDQRRNGAGLMQDPFSAMLPHGFMSPMSGMSPMSMMMMNPFQSMQQAMSMASNGNPAGGFSYCSSSVTSYTTDEHGRPQVYQQSNEVKQGPNGVKETKSAVRDSRSGRQELEIGHHLRDKAHFKKKSKNVYSGEEEQEEKFVNLEEEEAEAFESNWTRQARGANLGLANNQLGYGPSRNNSRLAITSGAEQEPASSVQRHAPYNSSKGGDRSWLKALKRKKKSKEERDG